MLLKVNSEGGIWDTAIPREILSVCSCPKERRFVVLKSYFDQSGKEEAPFMTLSGVAATAELWDEIENDWNYMLQAGVPKANYMHMNEAVFLKKEFDKAKGWDDDKVFGLVNQLLSYVTSLDKKSYCQFACTIDMNAYKKLQAETYQLDSPVNICNRTCVETVMQWYLMEYQGLDLEASYYFDQDEPFEPIFKAKWERETELDRQTGRYETIWSHIKHVGTAIMRKTPGIQLADMLAWGRNREENKGARFEALYLAFSRLAPTKWITWNEANLRKYHRPLIYKPFHRYDR